MCTGRDLVAGFVRARLPYVKRLVSGGVLGACRDMRVRAVHAYGVRGCGVDARRDEIDAVVAGKLASGWTLARLDKAMLQDVLRRKL